VCTDGASSTRKRENIVFISEMVLRDITLPTLLTLAVNNGSLLYAQWVVNGCIGKPRTYAEYVRIGSAQTLNHTLANIMSVA
jgi:hypothetical protein